MKELWVVHITKAGSFLVSKQRPPRYKIMPNIGVFRSKNEAIASVQARLKRVIEKARLNMENIKVLG